jgi:mono/diheme cytochrome c family protein
MRCTLADWAQTTYRLRQRRAARLIPVRIGTFRYRSIRDHQDALRQRLRELAAVWQPIQHRVRDLPYAATRRAPDVSAMRRLLWMVGGVGVAVVGFGIGAIAYVRSTGLESRSTPGALEKRVATGARRVAIPGAARGRRNPVASTPESLVEGIAHFAGHCASCHANDGSGDTEMGRGLYPKAPDMRLPATQNLADGELFYIVENGIRFTGMPSWSTGTKGGEESTWHLVQFIRHLPQLTESELETMDQLNPRSPEEVRQEIEEERFLNEGAKQ